MTAAKRDQAELAFEAFERATKDLTAADSKFKWNIPQRNAPRIPTEEEYVEILRVVRLMQVEDASQGIRRKISIKGVQERLVGTMDSEALKSRIKYVLDSEGIPRREYSQKRTIRPALPPLGAVSGVPQVSLETPPVEPPVEPRVCVLPPQIPQSPVKPEVSVERRAAVVERLARSAIAGDEVASVVLDKLLGGS